MWLRRHYVVSDVTMFMSWVPVARYLNVKDSLSSAGMAFRSTVSCLWIVGAMRWSRILNESSSILRQLVSRTLRQSRSVRLWSRTLRLCRASESRVKLARQNRRCDIGLMIVNWWARPKPLPTVKQHTYVKSLATDTNTTQSTGFSKLQKLKLL